MESGGARKSSKWAREAVCTIATDVVGTSPKTLKFTECRFYAQGRGIRGAFSGIEFSGLEFDGIDLDGIELSGVEVGGLEVSGLEVSGLEVIGCEFRDSISTESSSADWILGSNLKSSGNEK